MLGNLNSCIFLMEFVTQLPGYAIKRVEYIFKHIRSKYFIQSTMIVQMQQKFVK